MNVYQISITELKEPGYAEPTIMLRARIANGVSVSTQIHHKVNGGGAYQFLGSEDKKRYAIVVLGLAVTFAKQVNLPLGFPEFKVAGSFKPYFNKLLNLIATGANIDYRRWDLWPESESYQNYLENLIQELKSMGADKTKKHYVIGEEKEFKFTNLDKIIREIDEQSDFI